MARTFCPTCRSLEDPTAMGLGRFSDDILRTARSFSGSYPTIVADWGGMPCSFTLMMGLPAFAADVMTW